MEEKGRIENSIFNLISGFGYRIISLLTAFIVRTVFIHCLNTEYLGINGLYSNILNMLSLAELGFGTAMVYSMYQPLARKNYDKLRQLMKLYKKVYKIIGTLILILGLCLVPFLDNLIKDKPNINGLTFYYILFLLNSVVSYWFFAYKNSILQADQKAYISTNYNSIFNLIKSFLQIILLIVFRNFTVYLLTQILCTIGTNICISMKVNKLYPDLLTKDSTNLPKNETKKIFLDVKALMLSKISHVALNSTDNIIISAFIGIKWTGLLSNFTMISDAVTSILCQITSAIMGSLGNYFAKEDKESGFKLFLHVDFMNFWLYGFSMIALIVLLNPFIYLWLGEDFMLDQGTVVALSINYFVAGFMNTLWTFRSTLGLFTQGQYRPLIVALLNITLSIAFSYVWGITGVLAATSLSRACVNLWYDPWLIHRKGFNKSVIPYFKKYMARILLLVWLSFVLVFISNNVVFLDKITIVRFIFMTVFLTIVINAIFFVVYFKTEEFQYFCRLVKQRLIMRKKK